VTREGGRGNEGDRFLLSRIREGDEEAFRQLVERFTGRLKAYALRRLGRSSAEVEDAVQETFLGLLLNLERLKEVRSLEAYLFTILRNKLVDFARRTPKAHGLHLYPLGGGSEPGVEPVASGERPSHYAQKEEAGSLRRRVLADILEEALGTLKSEKRLRDLKVLELLFYCGKRGKEVAALVGTSEPTVTRIKAEAIERCARLARRHPRSDPSLGDFGPQEETAGLLSEVWRENLLSCLKRSTLGSHALGALEPEWSDYVKFHLETVGCETCAANLEDLRAGEESSRPTGERVFASSVGFLRQKKR
jgi:RNA polymerase sigma-70 factor (ECF subfamily)